MLKDGKMNLIERREYGVYPGTQQIPQWYTEKNLLACKLPMTKMMAKIIDHLGDTLDKSKTCEVCKDKSVCKAYSFQMKKVRY